ncbi:MAG: CAP domain-containing protein [Corynebacterium sp.]|nr:CAP domain-containing protein [Corynebacterium sp.]
MSHNPTTRNWKHRSLVFILVPSIMCGSHTVTASATPQQAQSHQAQLSSDNLAIPGIPDNILRILGPAIPVISLLAAVFAAAATLSKSGSASSANQLSSRQTPSATPSTEVPFPTTSEQSTATANPAPPTQTNGKDNQESGTGSASTSNSSNPQTPKPTATTKPAETPKNTKQQIQRLLDEINRNRQAKGLKPVTLDTALSVPEQVRAEEFIKAGGTVSDSSGQVVIISGAEPVAAYKEVLASNSYFQKLAERADVTKVGIGLATNGDWWGGFIRFQTEGRALSTNEQRMAKLVEKINAARAAQGAAPLQLAPAFNPEEQQWAQHMKASHKLYYQGIRRAVGASEDPLDVVSQWQNNEGFRFILTGKQYTHMAIGLVQDGNRWIVSARPLTEGVALNNNQQRIDAIVKKVNAERAKKSLKPLIFDTSLQERMQSKADAFSRSQQVWYTLPVQEIFALEEDPIAAVDAWLAKEESKNVLFSPTATKVGVALAQHNNYFGVAAIIPQS